jgi:uncharacterized membrane protein
VSLKFSDWKWACVAAFGLLGVAAFIVFAIHPGGFEGQIGWFFSLLPGAIVGASLSDRVFKVVPLADAIVLWISVYVISFLWYFAISYAVIKTGRFVARALKH